MATATRSPLVEQAERLHGLAQHLSDGRLLEKPLRLAGSDTVWTGPIRDGFLGWMAHALDFWVRNQLAEGLRLVARSLFDRAAAVEQAAAQMLATGQVTVAPPAPPAPLNYTPGTPPAYGDIGGGGVNHSFNASEMRNLSHLLLATADEVMNFARAVDQALVPPPAPPPPPGAPPPINPLPPDAEAVVGYPQAYIEIAHQLRNASMDVAKRADLVMAAEEPLPTTTIDLSIVATAAGGAAAQVAASDEAADAAAQSEEKPPPTEEEVRTARAEGTRLAEKALEEDVLDDPDELKKISDELKAHRDDPAAEAYAAAFVEKFGAKTMLAIPRALHSFKTGIPQQTTSGFELARRPPPKVPEEDIEDVLFAFSATLATATHSEGLDQKVEEKLLGTDDRLALSWLLANPHADFDAEFLVQAFKAGVLEQLKHEGAITGLGAYGGRTAPFELAGLTLSNDPKVVVLEAISRNEEAAMRIANHEFKPPLTIPMGLRPAVDVHNIVELLYLGGATNNGYADDGAALGRMLDTAHRGFCQTGGADNAKQLVDQILDGATNKKEVKAAQPSLRLIGLRQPVSEDDVNKALADVREEPKHPGREALLAMASQSKKAAVEFTQTAAEAASKTKVDPDKVFELRSLFQTEAAWDSIATVQQLEDPATRNLAEAVTEEAVILVAAGQDLTDAARRGLAKQVSANVAGFASSIFRNTERTIPEAGAERSLERQASAQGINVSLGEVVATMAELMKDAEARQTIELGAGNLTGDWSTATANQHLEKLLGTPPNPEEIGALQSQSDNLGQYLCAVIEGAGKSAENKAQAAVNALAGMRLGVDLVFMGVDFAKSFVPGGNVLLTQSAKWLFDQASDKAEGGLGIEGMPEHVEGGLKGFLSKDIQSREGAAWAEAKLDVHNSHVMVEELMRDTMTAGLLQGALTRPAEERDQLLDRLGIRAIDPDGTELRGVAALQDAGLIDKNGRFAVPPPGTDAHVRYERWASNEAPAFNGQVSDLSQDSAQRLSGCLITHLDIEQTGK